MSRFADALRRARTGSGAGSALAVDEGPDPIRFFAPEQPAVVSPWVQPGGGAARRATVDQRPSILESEPSVPLLPQRGATVVDRLEWDSTDRIEKFVAREQYRKLAAALHEAQLERGINAVLVTSTLPREGKTLTAANLALTLSTSYQRRVLLIDADLRHPTLHDVFGVENPHGLSDSLTASASPPFIRVNAGLSLLTAGASVDDPMKTLGSERMRAFVHETRKNFDWVLLDTPPIGLLPDARLLAPMADGALFVALAGKTGYRAIQRAAEALGPDHILGVVLNCVTDARASHTYDQTYYPADER